ncbi:MAG: hypothetical protein ABUS56_01405 [Acidobacteriota bacterium]
MRKTVASWALIVFGLLGRQAAAQSPSSSELDFEFFRTKVQPIFLAPRHGHTRCVLCHGDPDSRLHPHLAALQPGTLTWNEEESRKNFEEFSRVVVPGSIKSKLLVHPLAESAGGDYAHLGGKHFASQDDPEWQVLKAWVFGAKAAPGTGATKPRIIQTNFAGDNIDIIDPGTNKIVGSIEGIELNHGAAAAPDGSRIYVSDEGYSTLDVIDGRTLGLFKRIPLSGHPNNISIGKDGRRVYVSIASQPGAVDVIDTVALEVVKTIPTNMGIHNTYVTPDGKYVIAGSIQGKGAAVIDTATEKIAWTVGLDLGVRPMAMSTNPDGSTKWVFMQLTAFNGFAVIDFATHKEIKRITLPALPEGKKPYPAGNEVSHGIGITPDGKTLVVVSRTNTSLYSYSLPDLALTGTAELAGRGSGWLAVTQDGARAYVSNAVSDDVSVVDIKSMKEIARIPVGFSPKRNIAAMLP